MDECKGDPPAAAPSAAAAAAAAAERAEDGEMKDADQPAAASASSDAAAVFLSRMLPARSESAECDICNETLQSAEAAGAAAAESRLPRLLPCGHSWCTKCIQKSLDANGGSVDSRISATEEMGGGVGAARLTRSADPSSLLPPVSAAALPSDCSNATSAVTSTRLSGSPLHSSCPRTSR